MALIIVIALSGGIHLNATTSTVLVWVAGFVVFVVIFIAYFLAFSHAREVVRRNTVYVLTDTQLIQKRSGYPDVEMDLKSVQTLYKRGDWLVVEGTQPSRRIAIPDAVEGFQLLQAELTKYAPIVQAKQRSALGSLTLVSLYLVCWAIVLWSSDKVVISIALSIGAVSLCWQSLLAYRQSKDKQRRRSVWGWIGLGWIAAALAVCFRMLHR